MAAATTLFLRNGFRGTSMDEVAAAASVSKQTVYKQFVDKEALFREIVGAVTGRSDAVIDIIAAAFGAAPAVTVDELEDRLRAVARGYLDAVLHVQVLSLRRLIIAEADRFPDLARRYYEQAPARGIEVIAAQLRPYVEAGLLHADDLRGAAAHFAYLALAPAQDRAMFLPADLPDDHERDRRAAEAAVAFVAAYAPAARQRQRPAVR
nr:TetR/AcrR family transcriptional regulator [Microbacterium pseudoresistens]